MSGLNGLFTIANAPPPGTTDAIIVVRLNAGHPIFAAHFPGRPILPGVCMVHIAQAIAERMHGNVLAIRTARSIKFLAPVNPNTMPELHFHVCLSADADALRIDAQVYVGNIVVMKLKASAASVS